ncbi:TPA: hypothetical protein ACOZOI_001808 [Streptococcus pneumoniae]|nr:hypothetical protein [Streptococcus pneumoniae]CVM90302.1 Uncharacterised protein [Streptococcus pneumoniae]CVO32863.1 Uncharacterised protein [Streptococcus pneumoniae]CVO86541.1 Uncharacterised protein [Streptococcus pneumoniae]CVO90002.1 Uncharacterised protein [Streptococcus pneumoniae]CVP68814.1 Uncharacterised protein [Streptococcus pneumoniae]
MSNTSYTNYPSHVRSSVEKMNQVFDTPAKRKFVANKARSLLLR